ncbi:MAG: tetratricopeptide repeat protein [Elusimicrobia bacterium]|nr:tetratricopeptide repeat protein [Candidatus Liberimonas magnetica]
MFQKHFIIVITFVYFFSCPAFSKNIAVMPFNNITKDKETSWVGAGFSETLAAKLNKVKEINLLERKQLSKILDEITYQLSGVVDEKTAVKAGKNYGIDVIVLGSYKAEGDTLKVSARFINVEKRKVIGKAEATGKIDDIFKLQDEILFSLLDSLKITLAENEKQEIKKAPAKNLEAYQWFCKGKDAYNLRLYDKAIEYYQEALNLDPEYADAYYSTGCAYDSKGNTDKAIESCEKTVGIDRENKEAYSLLGFSYLKKGNFDKAAEMYEKAVSIDPGSAKAYCDLGLVYDKKLNYDKAIELYEKAANIDPDRAEAYLGIGHGYYGAESYDKAIEIYEKALAVNHDKDPAWQAIHPDVYYNIGFAYDGKGSVDKAIEACDKALAIDPNHGKTYFLLGLLYCKQLNYDKAIEMYEKAVSLNPYHADSYYNLGLAYRKKGNRIKMFSCFKKAARLGNVQSQEFLREAGLDWNR